MPRWRIWYRKLESPFGLPGAAQDTVARGATPAAALSFATAGAPWFDGAPAGISGADAGPFGAVTRGSRSVSVLCAVRVNV